MEAEVNRPDKEFGIIVRTNAADASKEEILKELEYLKGLYHKAAVDGRSRTCFSCVSRTEPFYIYCCPRRQQPESGRDHNRYP